MRGRRETYFCANATHQENANTLQKTASQKGQQQEDLGSRKSDTLLPK